ncbi:MAG TPA: insulinase family protein, partial [Vicinamibacterales bacterium]|nr:insulinase family protein [Vicinamibacterales bacterium]
LALVERYFGGIEAGERVDKIDVAASLPRDIRIQFEDRVELPRLYIAWLTPAMFAPGDAELDLGTDLLANGKTSRLYRRLVFEQRIATDVSASQNSREMMGYAQLTATAAPGHSLGEIEHVVFEEIDRGRVQAETQFMFRLQTVGGFGGKSDQLNAYNVFLHDPAYFDRDLARYQVVTHESLRDAARRYLEPAHRVTLSIVPHGRAALAAPDSRTAVVS